MPTAKHLAFKYPVSDLHADNYWVNKIYDYPEFVMKNCWQIRTEACQLFNS